MWRLTAAGAILSGIAVVAMAQEATPPAPKPPGLTVSKRPYDTKKLVSVSVPDNITRGRALWLQRCAYCHDGVGQPSYNTMGPFISIETIANLTEDGVRQFTLMGTERMPGFSHTLNATQMNDLMAFIKTIGPDQKPTAAQLAGKGPGAVQGD